jgi:hypothetical protein
MARHFAPKFLAQLLLAGTIAACALPERGSFGGRESLPPDGSFASGAPTGAPTGTPVGARVAQLRGDLANLQSSVASNQSEFAALRRSIAESQARYQAAIATITARLQVGTTPGNPELLSQWQMAQSTLTGVERDVGAMTALSTRVAATSSVANFLLGSTRASYALSGGIDQDHRDLGAIEDEVGRQQVSIDRTLNEISSDSGRLSAAVASDRRNLATLALAINSGRMYGGNLGGRVSATPSPGRGAGRPLATIRFDQPGLQWRQPLYNAVSSAIDRAPGSTFDVVAVTPTRGAPVESARAASDVRRNAEGVVRAMVEMGLPSDRVSLTASASPRTTTGEVQVFVR